MHQYNILFHLMQKFEILLHVVNFANVVISFFININDCNTRIFLNRGLKIGSDTNCGLAARGGCGDYLLGSIDSNKVVKGLCASNYYIAMDFFNTYTCNQLHHFGVKGIKSWVDSEDWCHKYEKFYHLYSDHE